MKRQLLFAIAILVGFIAPQFASAQNQNDKVPANSTPGIIKGPHGGRVIGSDEIRFELIDNGTTVSFYPVNKNGQVISAVPTVANCTIYYADLSQHYKLDNVALTNGCFTITPPREYPMFLYAIETSFNGIPIVAKYALNVKSK